MIETQYSEVVNTLTDGAVVPLVTTGYTVRYQAAGVINFDIQASVDGVNWINVAPNLASSGHIFNSTSVWSYLRISVNTITGGSAQLIVNYEI